MVQITLTEVEANTLREVLDYYISDLRMEIAGTERMNLRETLKGKETFLKGLLEMLQKKNA